MHKIYMARVTQQLKITDEVSIFKQENTDFWYARFKVNGKWYTRTTKLVDQGQATFKAAELRSEIETKFKQGIPLKSSAFAELANDVIADIERERTETGKRSYIDYVRAIQNYHIPFFGNYKLSEIDQSIVEEFIQWRKNEWQEKYNRLPSKSVLLTHNVALNRIFDQAVDSGQMSPRKRPKLTAKSGIATSTRNSFSPEDILKILDECKLWIDGGKKQVSRDTRKLLLFYVHFALATGIRPGTEIDKLTWKDFRKLTVPTKTSPEGVECYEITIRQGKTAETKGKRNIRIVASNIDYILVQLKSINKSTKSDDLVFTLPDGSQSNELGRNFKKVLKKLELDDHSNLTLYSLRHTYITRRLEEGENPINVARHCGTSMEMLQKHYNHVMFVDESEGHGYSYHEGTYISDIKLEDLDKYAKYGESLIPKNVMRSFGSVLKEDGIKKRKNKSN